MLRQENTGDENVIRETYYDDEGNKVVGVSGFVTRVQTLSKKKITSIAWLDENGMPMPLKGETYCRVEYTYDKAGNINREKYYGADGNPVRCSGGYAIVYREFDVYQQVVYEKFYDTDGFAVILPDGAVCYRYEYDEDGNMIRKTGYDYYDHEVE